MPRFEPFRALRYTAGPDLDDVAAPPYDVIAEPDRVALERRSAHNAVRLELPRDGATQDRYAEASCLLDAWLAEGVLAVDDEPAFYGYAMTYVDEDNRSRTTHGVLGALELEQPGRGILPHERTTSKAKDDRLQMLRSCRANLSPIWGLSATPGLAALCDGGELLAHATDEEGVRHELRRLDADAATAIAAAVAANPVVIADGHHRFEVANAYRAEDGAAPGSTAILALIVELAEDELVVGPIHRLVSGLPQVDAHERLEPWFTLRATDATGPALRAAQREAGALAVVTRAGTWLAVPRAETEAAAEADLDSARLDVAIAGLRAAGADLEVVYQHGADRCSAAVDNGVADLAVLLRPATVAQIAATGQGGQRMPPKTTFFWPKPRTGLAFRRLV